MYQPPLHREDRLDVQHALIEAHPFGLLISTGPDGLLANGLPFTLKRGQAPYGVLKAHVARANSQWQTLDGQRVLIVFQGPLSYVSPSFYETKQETGKVVPTWNYRHRDPDRRPRRQMEGQPEPTRGGQARRCAWAGRGQSRHGRPRAGVRQDLTRQHSNGISGRTLRQRLWVGVESFTFSRSTEASSSDRPVPPASAHRTARRRRTGLSAQAASSTPSQAPDCPPACRYPTSRQHPA